MALGVLLGATAEAPASAASGDMTVRSETGWQTAPLELAAGQAFTVDYRSGTWTVGSPGLALVGIDGYDAAADREIYQGCKILADQTYGHLLARVGGSAPFPVSHSGTFTAPASGQLQFRINDDDRCLGDNAGAVNLRVAPAAGETPGGTATPATPASGPALYAADWSPGLNGWAGDSSWKTLRGELLSDGTAWDSTIFAPYDTRTVADYAVEARIQVVKADMFGLVLRHSAGDDGYIGIVDADGKTWISAGNTSYSNDGKLADGYQVDVGTGSHTFRMEADGNVIRFLVDGAQVATATDNRYITGGLGGINSRRSQLEVSGFRVLRLS